MNKPWFKPWGRIHRPQSAIGYAVAITAALFCAGVFIVVDGRSHSVSDTLYGVFPYWTLTAVLYLWIASKRSAPAGGRRPERGEEPIL